MKSLKAIIFNFIFQKNGISITQVRKILNIIFFVFWDYDAGLPLESLQKLLQKRLIYFQRHLTPSTFCSRK
jgi:hypothetical protein